MPVIRYVEMETVPVIPPEEQFVTLKCDGHVVWKFEDQIIRDYRWDRIINGSIIYIYVHYPTVGYYTCEKDDKIIKRFGVFTKPYKGRIGASRDDINYIYENSCLPRNISMTYYTDVSWIEVNHIYHGAYHKAYCRFYFHKSNEDKRKQLHFNSGRYDEPNEEMVVLPELKQSQWISIECICKNNATAGTTGKIFYYAYLEEGVKVSPNAIFVSNVFSKSFVLYFELPSEVVIRQELLTYYMITVFKTDALDTEDILRSTKVSDIVKDFSDIKMMYEEFAVHVITNLQPETAYVVSVCFGNHFGDFGPYGKFIHVRTTYKNDVNPMEITRISLLKLEPSKVRLRWEGKVTAVNVQLFRTQKDIRYLEDVKDNDIEFDSLQELTFYKLSVEAHKPSTISTPIAIHFITPKKAIQERSKAKAKAAAVVEELQKSIEESERRIAEETESLEQIRQELSEKRVELNKRARAVEKKRTLMTTREGYLFKAFFKWKSIFLAICALQFVIIAGMVTFSLLQQYALYKMQRK